MRRSPALLVAVTVAGALLTVAGFGCAQVGPRSSWPVLLLGFLCVAVGLFAVFWAPYRLRDDVQNERWSEETLAPYRRVVRHPVYTACIFALLALMVVEIARLRLHGDGLYWATFCVLQAATQSANALRKPSKPARTFGLPVVDWSKVKPITSEHWGER